MEVCTPLVTSFVEGFRGELSETLRYGGAGLASGWPEGENWLKEEGVLITLGWFRYGIQWPIKA